MTSSDTDIEEIEALLEGAEDELETPTTDTDDESVYPDREQPLGTPALKDWDTPPEVPMMHELPDDYEPIVTGFFDERIAMDHWWPRLKGLNVPTPKTEIIPLEETPEGEMPEWDTERVQEIVSNFGGEAFVRSMYKSAMHLLHEGSYISDPNKKHINTTISELLTQHQMGRMYHGDAIAVREWLDLNFCSYAPDTLHPEVRFFVENGQVKYFYPRMNEKDFLKVSDTRSLYKTALELIQSDIPDLLTWASRVAEEFDEAAYSVDFVMTTDGDWKCTDMALDGIYFSPGKERWHNLSDHQSFNRFNLEEQFIDDLPDVDPDDIDADLTRETGR